MFDQEAAAQLIKSNERLIANFRAKGLEKAAVRLEAQTAEFQKVANGGSTDNESVLTQIRGRALKILGDSNAN